MSEPPGVCMCARRRIKRGSEIDELLFDFVAIGSWRDDISA